MLSQEFLKVYDTYKDRVYNTVLSYVQHAADAEELTQDVFLEVYQKLDRFRGDSAIFTWIYRIAINKCTDHIRYKNRQKRGAFVLSIFHRDSGELQHDAPVFDHPGVALEQKEQTRILFSCIYQLPSTQKTAFILSQLEHLGNQEIAAVMETTVGAVESLLHRAKANLRNILEKKLPGAQEKRHKND